MNFKSIATGLGILTLAAGSIYVASKTTLTAEDKSKIVTALEATAAALPADKDTSLDETLTEQLQAEGVSLKQWNEQARLNNDNRSVHKFFFLARTLPPEYIGSKLLGRCVNQKCGLLPSYPKAKPATWSYDIVHEAGGWKMARVVASEYFARGLKAWADSDSDNAHWLGGPGQIKQRCLSRFGAVACRAAIASVSQCWALFDSEGALDRTCMHGRYGSLPGTHPDLGQPCDPTDGQAWVPIDCVTSKGAGGAIDDAKRGWGEEEL